MRVFAKVTGAVTGFVLGAVAVWAAARYHIRGSLFSTEFLAHQYCYLRNPALIWTNATSDGLIWLSYVAIAVSLAMLLWRSRKLLPFRWVFVAFGIFIVACGFTHFFEMVTLWNPVYWLATSVKVLTAVASVATAIAFGPMVPRATGAIRLFHEAYSTSEKQRVETLSKLLDAEERMQLAVESAGLGTWDYNIPKDEIHWDERCRAIFGLDLRGELKLQDFSSCVHPEDLPGVQAAMRDALDNHREYNAAFRVLSIRGETRNVIARGKPFYDEKEQPVRLVGTVIDVTRERQADEALAKTDKLAMAGRMAASIAHEIANPLDAAIGLVYVTRVEADLPRSVQERLQTVEQELNRAALITRSTLSFYRESPTPVPTNPVEIVESVLTFQQGSIRKAGVELKKDLVFGKPMYAFPGELRQVLTNLIANAVEALQRNGKLSVRVRPAKDWRTGREGYRILVADNGPGISPEHRNRLFDPFYTTKGQSGTGLGLWITSQLVTKHGGRIMFRTCSEAKDKKRGTVFSVWLPLQHEFANVSTAATPPAA